MHIIMESTVFDFFIFIFRVSNHHRYLSYAYLVYAPFSSLCSHPHAIFSFSETEQNIKKNQHLRWRGGGTAAPEKCFHFQWWCWWSASMLDSILCSKQPPWREWATMSLLSMLMLLLLFFYYLLHSSHTGQSLSQTTINNEMGFW